MIYSQKQLLTIMNEIWEKLRPVVDLWSEICSISDIPYTLYRPGNVYELLYGGGTGNHDHFGVNVLGDSDDGYQPEFKRVRDIQSRLAEIFEAEVEDFPHSVELTYESLMKFKPEMFQEYFGKGSDTDTDTDTDSEYTKSEVMNWSDEYVRIMNLHEEYTDFQEVRSLIRDRTQKFIEWMADETLGNIWQMHETSDETTSDKTSDETTSDKTSDETTFSERLIERSRFMDRLKLKPDDIENLTKLHCLVLIGDLPLTTILPYSNIVPIIDEPTKPTKKIWRESPESIKFEHDREMLVAKNQTQLDHLTDVMNYSSSKFGFMEGNDRYIYHVYGMDRFDDEIVGIVGQYTEKIMVCARFLGQESVYNIPTLAGLALKLNEYIDGINTNLKTGEAPLRMEIMTPKRRASGMYLNQEWDTNPLTKFLGLKREDQFTKGLYLWVTKYI